jgi:hypothetical protein
MKTARFLLACAVASVLAACGTDTITAPAAPSRAAHPRFDSGSQIGTGSSTSNPTAPDGSCVPVTVVNPDGTTSQICGSGVTSQIGTGS